MEVDEVPDKGDVTPFPKEGAVIMINDGRPSPRVRYMSNLSPGTIACCGWGCRDAGK
jgi:hypothetical protein